MPQPMPRGFRYQGGWSVRPRSTNEVHLSSQATGKAAPFVPRINAQLLYRPVLHQCQIPPKWRATAQVFFLGAGGECDPVAFHPQKVHRPDAERNIRCAIYWMPKRALPSGSGGLRSAWTGLIYLRHFAPKARCDHPDRCANQGGTGLQYPHILQFHFPRAQSAATNLLVQERKSGARRPLVGA